MKNRKGREIESYIILTFRTFVWLKKSFLRCGFLCGHVLPLVRGPNVQKPVKSKKFSQNDDDDDIIKSGDE